MKITAFDLSLTCPGIAVYDHAAGIQVGNLKNDRRGMDRLAYLRRQVLAVAAHSDLVLIEGYAFARPNQAHQIGELGGVVRLALFEARLRVLEVSPASVKKLACGKGNAPKDEVLLAAVRRLGYAGTSSDEADARWVLEAGLHLMQLPAATKLPQQHLDALGEPRKALLALMQKAA